MTHVYIVTKEGVYRHDIIGIFLSEREARAAAEAAAASESDDYHSFDLMKAPLNTYEPEDHSWLVDTLKRKDVRKPGKREWIGHSGKVHVDDVYLVESFSIRWEKPNG